MYFEKKLFELFQEINSFWCWTWRFIRLFFRFPGHVSDRRLVTNVPHGGRRRILGVSFSPKKNWSLKANFKNIYDFLINFFSLRLHQIMNNSKIAMHGFFIHGFPKLMRFQQHHDKVMRKFLPRLVTFTNHRWRCCLIIQINFDFF